MKVQGGFCLDTVIGERLPIYKLLSVQEEPLLVLNLGLDIANRVSNLHLEPDDGLECLHGNLHSAAAAATMWTTKVKVERRIIVNVVRAKFAPVVTKLVAVKDDPLLVSYLGLDITDFVRWLYLKGNGLATAAHLDENLHRAEVEVQGSFVWDFMVVVSKRTIVVKLLVVLPQEEVLVSANLSPDVADGV